MELDLLLKKNQGIREQLDRRLKRRGLKIMPTVVGETHGPHYPDMDYVVYIVYVKDIENSKDQFWVSIYPRAIYSIDDPSDWWRADPESRIYTLDHWVSIS